MPERGDWHGRDVLPPHDGLGRCVPALAEGAIRVVVLELVREDAQRPRLEGKGIGAAGGADGRGQLGLE